MDPSSMTNVEERQKGKPDKLKNSFLNIIKKYSFSVNGGNINDRLKTTHELDRESRF